MFTATKDYELQQPTSQYFAGKLITQEWVEPGSGEHKVFRCASDVQDGAGHTLVTSYAVLRPDGQWSLMLVNKDQLNPQPVRIVFENETGTSQFTGQLSLVTFGSEQYQWHSNRDGGVADPDGPETRSSLAAPKNGTFTLPKASVTVIRGKLGEFRSHPPQS